MHNPFGYLIIIAMTIYFMVGMFYLGMSYYFMFKQGRMSDKENLEAYVKNKYFVRSYRYAFIASFLAVLESFTEGYYYLVGLAIIWMLIFLCLWTVFRRILKNKEKELERISIIMN